ncbi:MAG: hypothetical protein EOM59_08335 [Clostridia bacterium]|nr:hypothetical protein [Clostridia bacterium]
MNKRTFALFLAIMLCIIPTSITAANTTEGSDTVFVCDEFSAALTSNGDLYCWGFNNLGQVGNGSRNSVSKPAKVLSNVASFTAKNYNVAAVTQNGDLYTWGWNAAGLVGNGQKGESLVQLTPFKVLSNVSFVSMSEDDSFTAPSVSTSISVITKTGDLYCWGYTGNDVYEASPVKMLSNVASVASDNGAVAAITKTGDVYTWGRNSYGQIGNGKIGAEVYQATPFKVALSNIASISIDGNGVAALGTNGDLYGWGDGMMGRIGNGSSNHQTTPVKVLSNVAEYLNAGWVSTAITENGDLYCWGSTDMGQVGNGKSGVEDRQTTPVRIMENVAKVTTNGINTAAITTAGDLYTWGPNDWAQIGNGTMAMQVTPTKILSNISSAIIGTNSSAITKSGDLYCWGENGTGEVGNGKGGLNYDGYDPVGNSELVSVPSKVLGNVAASFFNNNTAIAVTKSGDLYRWGNSVFTPTKVFSGVKLPNAAPVVPAQIATPTAAKVLVDGKNISFDAYSIAGNNYFKLRDLAYVLNGSAKQFSVAWDGANNAIALQKGSPYTAVGGEMATKGTVAIAADPSTSKILLGGQTAKLTAYTIRGNNYFKLRDVGIAFDFDVSWNNALQTIAIDTTSSYTAD